jgi:hypothetical protein
VLLEQFLAAEECATFTLEAVAVQSGMVAKGKDRAEDGVTEAARGCHVGSAFDD